LLKAGLVMQGVLLTTIAKEFAYIVIKTPVTVWSLMYTRPHLSRSAEMTLVNDHGSKS
jgi:hypothetical protein